MKKSTKVLMVILVLVSIGGLIYLAPSANREAEALKKLETKQAEFGIPADINPVLRRVNPLAPNTYSAEYAWNGTINIRRPAISGIDEPEEIDAEGFVTDEITMPSRRVLVIDAETGESAALVSEN